MADEGGVLDELRAAILAGEFVAGQRLVEVDLCERFGCGRFAVRAAIPVLDSEGLVDVQRHRGARVRIIPLAEAIEITEVRRLLEGLIAPGDGVQASPLADLVDGDDPQREILPLLQAGRLHIRRAGVLTGYKEPP